ncbi:Oxidoreductase [Candidatus Terasakiella magnetica]|uniref:Oxidoreductase n=1 Tax=Candidatus Terasakiella magnetica TaxID=1867952 RepID=A0A1C3RH82_9PROT|nr:2OG-Fe(II) oxygenase [Candidatus Terasakiella magnetica]SCA56608.1 Oxidoreductase [Candidatus Terasakiella magnetica]
MPPSEVYLPKAKWLKSVDSAMFASHGVFSITECDQIIQLSKNDMQDTGLVNNQNVSDVRQSSVHWIDEEKDSDWVLRKIMREVSDINNIHFDFNLTDFSELIQIANYQAISGGHYDWHTDLGSSAIASRRKLTLVVQLSHPDEYEGGLLEVNVGGNIHQASLRQGSAILFPSFVLHRVSPVTKGNRYSLACWVHGPTFR